MEDRRLEQYKKLHQSYKEFFGTESGLEILKDLKREYRIDRCHITNMNEVDPIAIACREAQRGVVLRILNLANGEPLKRPEQPNQ